jgi:hypothetical protein
MNVDIISKVSHARAAQEMLERNGHAVTLLGSEAPDRLSVKTEVLVVRSTSCSHAATDFAVEVHRKKEIPVLFEVGATRITQLVNELAEKKKAEEKKLNTAALESPKVTEPSSLTTDSAAEKILNLVGFWTNFLVSSKSNANKMVDRLSAENLIQPHQRAEAGSLLSFLYKKSVAGISAAGRHVRKTIQGKPEFVGINYMSSNSALGTLVVRSSFPKEKVDRILTMFGLTRNLSDPRAFVASPPSAAPQPQAKTKPKPKPEPRLDSGIRDIEDLATPSIPVPVPVPVPVPPKAEPKVEQKPETISLTDLTEGMEVKQDENLKAAIELLVSAMREGSYKEVIVDDKGNVSFKRVRVQVGSFKI